MKFSLNKFALVFASVFLFVNFGSAQTEYEKGIELYRQGKDKEAVAALEKASKQSKTDAEVWNYLGLASMKIKDYKKAIKAFDNAADLNRQNVSYFTNLAYAYLLSGELIDARQTSSKAINLDAKNAKAYFIRAAANLREDEIEKALADIDKAIAANPDYSLAYNFKADILLAKFDDGVDNSKPIINADLLGQAKEVLEFCLKNCRDNTQAKVQQERIERLTAFYDYFKQDENAASKIGLIKSDEPTTVITTDANITPVRILSLPRMTVDFPLFFWRTRRIFSAKIRVAVLFADTGHITHTLIVKGDRSGLDLNQNAVNAALRIKYIPATKNDRPISQINIIEYHYAGFYDYRYR